ncbi:hypothetical protein B0H10DRAFT_2238509 [Mycena sp. CBHHK59/15]|nr:hypothetical protein B0H10DRAFT_2238509 [Mycena sp. CBHHK59/15]
MFFRFFSSPISSPRYQEIHPLRAAASAHQRRDHPIACRLLRTQQTDCTPHLRFVIQDRPVDVAMGVHNFFTPQPITDAAIFLLRVMLVPRLGRRVRAAHPAARLVLVDFVLPLACVDDFGVGEGGGCEGTQGGEKEKENRRGEKEKEKEPQVEGMEKMLAILGKASANAYRMDLTVRPHSRRMSTPLREIVALALSAGWKVVRVTRPPGSLFGHIVAVPVAVPFPPQCRARAGSGSAFFELGVGAGACADGGWYNTSSMPRRSKLPKLCLPGVVAFVCPTHAQELRQPDDASVAMSPPVDTPSGDHSESAADILLALYDSDRADQEALCGKLIAHLPIEAPLLVELSILLQHVQMVDERCSTGRSRASGSQEGKIVPRKGQQVFMGTNCGE